MENTISFTGQKRNARNRYISQGGVQTLNCSRTLSNMGEGACTVEVVGRVAADGFCMLPGRAALDSNVDNIAEGAVFLKAAVTLEYHHGDGQMILYAAFQCAISHSPAPPAVPVIATS